MARALFCRPRATAMVITALLSAMPWLAQAHVGAGPAHSHGFDAAVAGFLHPFTGLDHLLAMLTLGAWSALTARRIWAGPAAFVGTLCVGAWAGLSGLQVPAVEPMIAVSLLVLGLLLVTRRALPAWLAPLLAGAFAFFHGVAHGSELAGGSAAWMLAGMVVASGVLQAIGVSLGLALRDRGAWWPRLAGSGVVLFGAVLLIG